MLAMPMLAHAQEYGDTESKSLTGVDVLHGMLEDQCTFAPDLDVGSCCAAHDIAYAVGGNEFDRYDADVDFYYCIRAKNRPIVAVIYYIGVRTFGWLFFNYGGSTMWDTSGA